MSLETYNVYFSGQIMKDRDPAEVRKKLGAKFKLEGTKLDAFFSGKPVLIKKAVDMEQAVKFRVTFRDAGALVDIRPVERPAAQPDTALPSGSDTASDETFTLSEPGSFDLSDCTPPVQPQPIPDISALALDRPGVSLAETGLPNPAEIDTSELELDKPGVILDENTPAATSIPDIPDLSLSQAREGSLEEYQQPIQPTPIPNIDHLMLEAKEERPSGRAKFDTSDE